MLPALHRMRSRDDFTRTVRRGRRAGGPNVVAHLLLADPNDDPVPCRIGFVVSKAVGVAVVRNRVKRRLRAIMADQVDRLPPGSTLVVRANPVAAQASSADLARCVMRVMDRLPVAPRMQVGR